MKKIIIIISCILLTAAFCYFVFQKRNDQGANNTYSVGQHEELPETARESAADKTFDKDKIDERWFETVVISDCNIKNGPAEDCQDIGILKYGDTVILTGSYNGWFRGRAKNNYLNEFWVEGKNIADYDYSDKDKRRYGVLTAEKITIGQINLYRGNLVWILKIDSGRTYVRPVVVDISGDYSGWIKNTDYVIYKAGVYFNQAFLRKNTTVYRAASEKSEVDREFMRTSAGFISIIEVQADGWVYIFAGGGIDGWVKDTDIYIP